MTDKELLDAAAKAAGVTAPWSEKAQAYRWPEGSEWVEWNPLVDDGDALRLVVKLGLLVSVHHESERMKAHVVVVTPHPHVDVTEPFGDAYAATRRAIVRAAAMLGDKQ